MRVLGLEIRGNKMVLILLDGDEDGWRMVDSQVTRMQLTDPGDQNRVKLFKEEFDTLVANLRVDVIAIKARPEKGTFAGSGASFKIEGLVQLAENATVYIISPNTIRAVIRRHPVTMPDGLHKYQHDAFAAAYCYLNQ